MTLLMYVGIAPYIHMASSSTRSFLICFFLCFAAIVACRPAWTQTPTARIIGNINEGQLRTLPRNVHPLARAEFDRGPGPADLPMDRMLLVLSRSAAQESDLENLLTAQQDPSSPEFRRWLTPEQFGARFGAADADIQTVARWLESQGFTVNRVSKGKTIVEFSGTAGQVQLAFHTQIHKYVVNGEEHWANTSNPQIPDALTPVVAGVATLHNFTKNTQLINSGRRFEAQLSPEGRPQFTSSTGAHALSPGDYRLIYNITTAGGARASATVAVVGRSNIQVSDVALFSRYFLNSVGYPQIVVNGPDPGDLGGDEEAEAVLDSSWAIAIDPSAVELVISKTTNVTDGVDLSEEYIIDKNIADVMTESFGSCEAHFTQAQASFYSSLAQQAAAQGITYVVAAGDSGSSGCDLGSSPSSSGVLSVNLLASNPYVTAVGGTEFNENGNDAAYWGSTNTFINTNYTSALSYIPEEVWNESCTGATGSNPCAGGSPAGLWAGGGGASSIYSKASWQTGVPGIPNDGARDVPDVSLTAAGHDPYLICLDGSCTPNSLGRISFVGYAGTSAATPSFAGFVALLVQQNGRLGSINPLLYQLAAAEALGNCNASNASSLPANNCVFNDVTVGNNSGPGEAGYNTSSGRYQAGVGYDLATGLGSVNEGNLAQAILSITTGTPVLTLSAGTLAFGNVTIGTSKTLQVAVSNTGTGALRLTQFSIGSAPTQYSVTGCAAIVLPGQSCTLTFVFKPTKSGDITGFPFWFDNTRASFYEMTLSGTGVATATAIVSTASLSFGGQNVVTRSAIQSITITNSTAQALNANTIALNGANPADFAVGNNCGTSLAPGASCAVYVNFTPMFAGSRSATLAVPVSGSGAQTAVALNGTGVLQGRFEIVSMRTGKVLEVAGGSTSNGASIQQNALNGFEEQQWQLLPTGDGYYEIQNTLTGKALDVTGGYTAGGTLIQQWDYLSTADQQWQLVPIDDVHYAIVNRNSGLALDVRNGSTANGAQIQQWPYLGDQQQLWILVPAGSYNISNNFSSYLLDVYAGATANGAPIDQWLQTGYREQQWQFVPVGGGYYAIMNRNSGKVLDLTGGYTAGGTIIQQWDYLGGENQQWQIVPLDAVNYKIVNRLTGQVLDDTNFSTAIGTFVQQWNYVGGSNQQWQITPVTYYTIVNRQSGLVLDIVNGSTADGAFVQQWASNGFQQQQWQLVLVGGTTYMIVNNLTSKLLIVANSSTSDGALIQQWDYLPGANQLWQFLGVPGAYYEIQNLNSGKVLDMTGGYLYGGALLQQWDYLSGANQQWQLVPIGN